MPSEAPKLPKKGKAGKRGKKSYSRPQLIVHGTIEKITEAAGPGAGDLGLMS